MPYTRLQSTGEEATFLFAPGADDTASLAPIQQQLNGATSTPAPASDDERDGPIRRRTEHVLPIGAQTLRRIALTGAETADAIRTRRDELYRNEFPRLEPRFAMACDACDAQFDAAPDGDACPACGADDLREPDPAQKRRAKRQFASVNPEGQSLRDVAKRAEADQWVTGVSTLVIEHKYQQAATETALYREGEIYRVAPTAIYRADPLAVRPRTDDDGRPGGKWACPIHREAVVHEDPGRCQCGADLREVWFVELGNGSGRTGRDDTHTRYFREEVITWSYAHPRLRGLDGIAPAAHVWLKQAILEMMDRWGGAYYNQSNDRLPGKMYLVHTTNPDGFEDAVTQARDDEDRYKQSVLTTALDPDNVEITELDGMPDELLGQSEAMKSQFKSDIRQAFGISDVHDSDLKDAGGLNNEGLQLEVVDRSLASQMLDYREGWLDTLMKRLGFGDWQISFLPERGNDADALRDNLKAAAFVEQAGGSAEIVDGELHVEDFEVDLDDSEEPPSLQGAPNLPGVGSAVPDAGAGGGGGGAAGFQQGATQSAADRPADDLSTLRSELHALEQAAFGVRGVDAGVRQSAIAQQGAPVYATREDVPPNVQRRISDAVRRNDFRTIEDASSARLEQFFEEKLTQPQGWSVDSLARGLREQGLVESENARTAARTESAAILSRAREDATAELAANVEDDVLHYWDGPDDGGVSEMCQWLKEQTNPEFGGIPVPMDELRDLQEEAIRRFSEQDPGATAVRDFVLHPQERHTFRSVLASEVDQT